MISVLNMAGGMAIWVHAWGGVLEYAGLSRINRALLKSASLTCTVLPAVKGGK